MPRCDGWDPSRLRGVAAATRLAALVVVSVLLMRYGADVRDTPASDGVGASIETAGLDVEPPVDLRASAWHAVRTMQAFVLWFGEAVVGGETD